MRRYRDWVIVFQYFTCAATVRSGLFFGFWLFTLILFRRSRDSNPRPASSAPAPRAAQPRGGQVSIAWVLGGLVTRHFVQDEWEVRRPEAGRPPIAAPHRAIVRRFCHPPPAARRPPPAARRPPPAPRPAPTRGGASSWLGPLLDTSRSSPRTKRTRPYRLLQVL